ncbi:STAS domain-containing protein [Streptobacillus notomytis]|uniref:STAS domain-containing protein n=1 Tax=Streptobacillus notomytis TaxID=1712031 RepID=UPI00082BBC32|nr:STAS domain-containing protein [Streptobacillus notomytis]
MDNFLYAKLNDEYIFKICGRATMKNSKIFSDFVDDKINEAQGISFDMSETTYMDSTFLGLVAKYSIDVKMSKGKNLVILNPSEESYTFLKQTGIIKFVDLITKEDLNIDMNISGSDFSDMNEKSKYILEMHEILMKLNEENEKVFKPVVDAMKKVIK